jgi:hypothetical protein
VLCSSQDHLRTGTRALTTLYLAGAKNTDTGVGIVYDSLELPGVSTASLRVAGSYNSYLEVARDLAGDGPEELLAIHLGVGAADSVASQWPRWR